MIATTFEQYVLSFVLPLAIENLVPAKTPDENLTTMPDMPFEQHLRMPAPAPTFEKLLMMLAPPMTFEAHFLMLAPAMTFEGHLLTFAPAMPFEEHLLMSDPAMTFEKCWLMLGPAMTSVENQLMLVLATTFEALPAIAFVHSGVMPVLPFELVVLVQSMSAKAFLLVFAFGTNLKAVVVNKMEILNLQFSQSPHAALLSQKHLAETPSA